MPPLVDPVLAMPRAPYTPLVTGQCVQGASPSAPFSFKAVAAAASGAEDPGFIAAAMAQLAVAVQSAAGESYSPICLAIGEAIRELIPEAEQAAVLIPADDSQPVESGSAAAADSLGLLSQAQDSVGEGPRLDAASARIQVLVHDLRTDSRWPHLMPRSPWQIRSLLCTPIPVGAATGVITVVSSRAWAFNAATARVIAVVAVHSSLALAHLQQVRNLQRMAEGRDVIGQAKGMLMERHHLTAEQAFAVLAQASQERNVKVRTLCQRLADSGEFVEGGD